MRTRSRTVSSWCLWPLLLASLAALGEEPAQRQGQEGAAPEFLDFLEYLGSWNGEEEDWVQFLDEDENAPHRDAVEEPVVIEDPNDVVS
jgi:hypothetical protein